MLASKTKAVDAILKSLAVDEIARLRIRGVCMQPVIADGVMAHVRHQRFYLPGDIVVKRDEHNQLIAHRLIGCYWRQWQLYYVTAADNAERADAASGHSTIIGRLTHAGNPSKIINVSLSARLRASGWFLRLVGKRLFQPRNRS